MPSAATARPIMVQSHRLRPIRPVMLSNTGRLLIGARRHARRSWPARPMLERHHAPAANDPEMKTTPLSVSCREAEAAAGGAEHEGLRHLALCGFQEIRPAAMHREDVVDVL